MNIAYIAGFQGPELIRRRSITKNRALAGSQKIAMVASAIASANNNVKIFSHGITTGKSFIFDRNFSEDLPSDAKIRVLYAASLACKGINVVVAAISLLRLFVKENNSRKFNMLMIYNLALPESVIALYATLRGIPVILEYEDSAVVSRVGKLNIKSIFRKLYLPLIKSKLSGVIAPSPELLDEINTGHKMLLRGTVEQSLIDCISDNKYIKKQIILYSGSLSHSKGVDLLIESWVKAPVAGWELHITGAGPLSEQIKQMSQQSESIVYHGIVSRAKLTELLCSAKICVNPHRSSSTPGNVFAFKIVEYLAADCIVVTTPMGVFDAEMIPALIITKGNSHKELHAGIIEAISKDVPVSVGAIIRNKYGYNNLSALLKEFLKV